MESFYHCQNIEKNGDLDFIPLFKEYLIGKHLSLKKMNSIKDQKKGDYLIYGDVLHKGEIVQYEAYIDRKHETSTSRNLFFEIFSNRITNRLGWGLTSPSRYIVYSFKGHPIYTFIDLKKLRQMLKIDNFNHESLIKKGNDEYISSFKCVNGKIYQTNYLVKDQKTYTQRNLTQGILLPFLQLRFCLDKTLKINNGKIESVDYNEFLKIAQFKDKKQIQP